MDHHLTGQSGSGSCSGSGGGCGSGAPGLDALGEDVRRKVAEHPCYSEGAHHHFARMHAAVAPACNIQCNYCNRKFDCSNESRPGVVSEVLTPDQAVLKTLAVAAAIPQMSVLGIAGPGDPLANPGRTFAVFRELAVKAPDLKLCVSTNGLALPEHVEELARLKVDHVTITINCLDPDIGAQIYPWIFWNHRRVRGREAAEILIAQQQKGLEMLVERGILVKVNSVMIPGINDRHLAEVSRHVRAKGAFLHNVMPLIAAPEHGTYFGLTGQRSPSPEELQALQDECAGDMNMMRHCRQCRADAVGLLGEDRSSEFSLDRIAGIEIDHEAALARRIAYRARVEAEAAEKKARAHAVPPAAKIKQVIALHPRPASAKESDKTSVMGSAPAVTLEAPVSSIALAAASGPASSPTPAQPRPALIAVATEGGGIINQHFGHAREFLVYEASAAGVRFIGRRGVDLYCAGEDSCGDDGESKLEKTLRALAGCEVVLCSRIGIDPWRALEEAGITPNSERALEPIEDAVLATWQELAASGRLNAPAPQLRRA